MQDEHHGLPRETKDGRVGTYLARSWKGTWVRRSPHVVKGICWWWKKLLLLLLLLAGSGRHVGGGGEVGLQLGGARSRGALSSGWLPLENDSLMAGEEEPKRAALPSALCRVERWHIRRTVAKTGRSTNNNSEKKRRRGGLVYTTPSITPRPTPWLPPPLLTPYSPPRFP